LPPNTTRVLACDAGPDLRADCRVCQACLGWERKDVCAVMNGGSTGRAIFGIPHVIPTTSILFITPWAMFATLPASPHFSLLACQPRPMPGTIKGVPTETTGSLGSTVHGPLSTGAEGLWSAVAVSATECWRQGCGQVSGHGAITSPDGRCLLALRTTCTTQTTKTPQWPN
jgi:hypothetical protein